MSDTIKIYVTLNDELLLDCDINGKVDGDSLELESTQLCYVYERFVEKRRFEIKREEELKRAKQAEQIKLQADRLLIVLKGHPINQQIKLLSSRLAVPLFKRLLNIKSVKETDTEWWYEMD